MTSGNPWVVFAVSSAAVFLVSVDATIAVAAFPALRLSFADAAPSDLSWVLNAYTILYAALLVPAGRLVDLHGSRRLFLIGVAVFTLASAACGLAPGMSSLIAARVVQAVGGAILTPASLALILGAIPPEKRTAIVGMWSGVGALGAAVGPGAGGILIEFATWRAGQLWLATHVTGAPAYLSFWLPLQVIGGVAIGLLLVGLAGAAVAGLPPERFGVGGAVNNAVRQLGGVIGTAIAVVLIGQPDTPLAGFETAFVWISALSVLTAVIALGLPSKSGLRVPA